MINKPSNHNETKDLGRLDGLVYLVRSSNYLESNILEKQKTLRNRILVLVRPESGTREAGITVAGVVARARR